MSDYRHKNYEILNLIGYGLAKFDLNFVQALGFKTKTAFYKSLVSKGVADTVGTIKNRQDLFDPFLITNGKVGGKREVRICTGNYSSTRYFQTITQPSLPTW